jgi:hypothetical protein
LSQYSGFRNNPKKKTKKIQPKKKQKKIQPKKKTKKNTTQKKQKKYGDQIPWRRGRVSGQLARVFS